MREPSVSVAGDSFPKIFVSLSPHYAYGWVGEVNGHRQMYLHDIEVVRERCKGIGRTMLRAFIEAGGRLGAEELVTVPVTSDGVVFLNGLFQPAEPAEMCSTFHMPLEEVAARLQICAGHD